MSDILIVNERPEGLDFDKYKEVRRYSNARLKQYLKGTLVFEAVRLMKFGNGFLRTDAKVNKTFRGRTEDLQPV